MLALEGIPKGCLTDPSNNAHFTREARSAIRDPARQLFGILYRANINKGLSNRLGERRRAVRELSLERLLKLMLSILHCRKRPAMELSWDPNHAILTRVHPNHGVMSVLLASHERTRSYPLHPNLEYVPTTVHPNYRTSQPG